MMVHVSHDEYVVRETADEFGVDLVCECGWTCHLRHDGNAKEYIGFHITLVRLHDLAEYDPPVYWEHETNPCGEILLP